MPIAGRSRQGPITHTPRTCVDQHPLLFLPPFTLRLPHSTHPFPHPHPAAHARPHPTRQTPGSDPKPNSPRLPDKPPLHHPRAHNLRALPHIKNPHIPLSPASDIQTPPRHPHLRHPSRKPVHIHTLRIRPRVKHRHPTTIPPQSHQRRIRPRSHRHTRHDIVLSPPPSTDTTGTTGTIDTIDTTDTTDATGKRRFPIPIIPPRIHPDGILPRPRRIPPIHRIPRPGIDPNIVGRHRVQRLHLTTVCIERGVRGQKPTRLSVDALTGAVQTHRQTLGSHQHPMTDAVPQPTRLVNVLQTRRYVHQSTRMTRHARDAADRLLVVGASDDRGQERQPRGSRTEGKVGEIAPGRRRGQDDRGPRDRRVVRRHIDGSDDLEWPPPNPSALASNVLLACRVVTRSDANV